MRWANLTLTDDTVTDEAPDAPALPLALSRAVRRTFDTPEFKGMTFYEVRAKSIINRVPGTTRLPFEWTVNPYRGCSHACSYCLAGHTEILMADGRTRAIADLRVGDAIYGTRRLGADRRYVVTTVRDHWFTVQPAYRVTLEDGTRLIASADHRFLSERGWKHVTGREPGGLRRPHLTTRNKLIGTGAFAISPPESPDYRRGYLCGLIRGDGHLDSYSYPNGAVHRFRLAMIDGEALARARRYLADHEITTREFAFQAATGRQKAMDAIRTCERADVASIRTLVRWPDGFGPAWSKGFLAGIFDAEGSYSGGILRIATSDPEMINYTMLSLYRLGFDFAIEKVRGARDMTYVRVRGGLVEHLRFFHTVDPAISRKRSIAGRAVKTNARLGVRSIEPLGIELPLYDITTGTGDFIAGGVVSHNCFARHTHTYLDLDAGHDFDTQVVVKVNAGAVLRRDLAGPRWRREPIAMGTNVDCYQRAEGRYRLMREVLAALRDFANPFSILTKGTLILRDLDLLRQAASVTTVGLAMSVGFVDERLWRSVESGTPSPRRRLDAVRQLSDAGFAVSVLMAPILPVLTDSDESIDATVGAIAAAGAASVTPLALHLRPGAREWYLAWLARSHPALLPRYHELYARGAYLGQAYQREVAARVRQAVRRHGLRPAEANTARRQPDPAVSASAPPEQLTLL